MHYTTHIRLHGSFFFGVTLQHEPQKRNYDGASMGKRLNSCHSGTTVDDLNPALP